MSSRKLDSCIFTLLLLLLLLSLAVLLTLPNPFSNSAKIAPKIFLINSNPSDASTWKSIPDFNLLAHNHTLSGLSSSFSSVHCTSDSSICQLITGKGAIHAAMSTTTLLLSPLFDFRQTYFILSGVGRISPRIGSIGSVTFARFVIQPSLQYEIDGREIPENFTTGYVPLGSKEPGVYPSEFQGTEVFELNDALRNIVVGYARTIELEDSNEVRAYRESYADRSDLSYGNAVSMPGVLECDVATSDTFVAGHLLGEAWQNYTELVTDGQGVYCTTAHEDSAVLEVLLRANIEGLVEFGRVVVMRAGGDYDGPPAGVSAVESLSGTDVGYPLAQRNMYLTGVQVVKGILDNWDSVFKNIVTAENYIGDMIGSLGERPDFGPSTVDNDGEIRK